MLTAALLFSARDWLLPAAGLVALIFVFLWWGYRRTPVDSGYRRLAFR